MRILLVGALLVGALVSSVGGAEAQVRVGVAGGPVSPMGDFGDAVERGYHGGVVLDLGFPLLPLSVHGDLMFQRSTATDPRAQDYRHLAGTVNGRFDVLPVPLIAVYLTGGAGLYLSDYADTPLAEADGWESEPGLNVGIGASLSLVVVRAFAELRYHRVMSDPARSFVPLTVGVTLF